MYQTGISPRGNFKLKIVRQIYLPCFFAFVDIVIFGMAAMKWYFAHPGEFTLDFPSVNFEVG